MKKSHIIFALIAFSLAGILMFTLSISNLRKTNKQINDIFDTYYSHVDYILKGQVISKKLLYDYGSHYKDAYILTVQVDSMEIMKNELSDDERFFGIYDSELKRAYIISPIYSYRTFQPYGDNEELPRISVLTSTRDRTVKFSDGLELGMIISDSKDVFNEFENENTIHF